MVRDARERFWLLGLGVSVTVSVVAPRVRERVFMMSGWMG